MKRKLTYTGIIILALVLTSGIFAYTYSNAAATTTSLDNVITPDAGVFTYNVAAVQPNWESLLPEGEYASEKLYPDAAGDLTGIANQTPSSGAHWDKVDDVTTDNWTTYVSSTGGSYQTDLYDLTDHPADPSGVVTDIASITLYYTVADTGSSSVRVTPVIKTYGTPYSGTESSLSGSTFTTKSYKWAVNPLTLKTWTWDEVNGLQAGVSLRGSGSSQAACTQVYVAVNYKYVITEGDVPEGNLYDITPNTNYTGDMQIRIYLVNTGNVLKAYRYLNMELYVKNSLEADESPRYQLLSLQNGVASFNIQGGAAASYTVEVWGGSYSLTSDDSSTWATGWSITPEFYCEVTQR